MITEEDKKDITGILPALGEIIRCADESSELSQICCCNTPIQIIIFLALHQSMDNMLASVKDDFKGMQ